MKKTPNKKQTVAPLDLRKRSKPPMIMIAPGVYAPDPAADGVPEISLGRFVKQNDGHYKFVPILESLTRVNAKLVKLLGMENQWESLRRLARAGFIEMIKVSPGCSLLNLNSWFNHLDRCARDPEFWQRDGANFKEYREALPR